MAIESQPITEPDVEEFRLPSEPEQQPDDIACEHCGTTFDPATVEITRIPSATLFLCLHCSRWTE